MDVYINSDLSRHSSFRVFFAQNTIVATLVRAGTLSRNAAAVKILSGRRSRDKRFTSRLAYNVRMNKKGINGIVNFDGFRGSHQRMRALLTELIIASRKSCVLRGAEDRLRKHREAPWSGYNWSFSR